MKINLELKPADAWIGLFLQHKKGFLHVWICIIPFFPVHIIAKNTNAFTNILCLFADKKEIVLISIGEADCE